MSTATLFAAACLTPVIVAVAATPGRAQNDDLVVLNGRVMDPENQGAQGRLSGQGDTVPGDAVNP